MQYKLIALDMDGTVLDSNKQISKRTASAIKKAIEYGVHVVLSTGRSIVGLRQYNEALKLKSPVISYNGGMVLNPADETVLYQKNLRPEDAQAVMQCGQTFGVSQIVWSNGSLYTFADTPQAREYAEKNKTEFTIIEDAVALSKQGITKVLWSDDPEQIARYQKELPHLLDGEMSYFTSCLHYLEFTDKEVSKGNALAFLSEHLQIAPAEMIAVGDGMNDESMLRYVGLGVAMENAVDAVKGFADMITSTNDEDGVAQVIEKFILGT